MKRTLSVLFLLAFCTSAFPAYFLDSAAMDVLLQDYEEYQIKREIRFMAKASQFVGYVTGIVDALDGNKFCLPGGVDAERATAVVAAYARQHPTENPRHASEKVISALATQYPCRP